MAAAVSIRVYTGADAATQSDAVTGIDFLSADNATNSTANRAAFPITAGTRSYEKWIRAYVDTAADNYVSTFQLWGDGAVQASTVLYVGKTATGVTPTTTTSAVATNTWVTYTSTSKFAWHATNMTGVGSTSDAAVLQLLANADAAAGNWTQETVNYSFNEA
jgi:hypothetical protein